jgi:hypothetical protein
MNGLVVVATAALPFVSDAPETVTVTPVFWNPGATEKRAVYVDGSIQEAEVVAIYGAMEDGAKLMTSVVEAIGLVNVVVTVMVLEARLKTAEEVGSDMEAEGASVSTRNAAVVVAAAALPSVSKALEMRTMTAGSWVPDTAWYTAV